MIAPVKKMADLKKYYNDPKFEASYTGKERFYKAVKGRHPFIKRSAVENYLKSDDTYTLHKPVQKPKRYRRVYTKGIGYLYQIDLVDMTAYARSNRGYGWIIMVLDTFSKKLWAFKTKNKKGKTITDALRPLLTRNKPIKIETDKGKEFKNSHFRALLRRLKIKTYSIESERHCSLVERSNRTIKTRMWRAFTAQGSHVWYNILDDLIHGYNNSIHRSIGMKPVEVNSSNETQVRAKLFPPEPPKKRPQLKVGDSVRITRKKSAFQKGYEQSHSWEVFYVHEIKDTNPVTYGIKDYNSDYLKGSFYSAELLRVDKSTNIYPIERIIRRRTVRGRTQYLVKYLGYTDIFNDWIDQADLFGR